MSQKPVWSEGPFIPLNVRGGVVIHLTRGKHALVSTFDWSRVKSVKYHAIGPMKSGQWYAEGPGPVLLHRVIMRAGPGQLVDHVRDDGLDCRRQNIRICTVAQNQANRHARLRPSGVKGVHWHKAAGKWCAQIRVNKVRHYLGLFDTEAEAGAAYDRAAVEHWGEFANGNNISAGPARVG